MRTSATAGAERIRVLVVDDHGVVRQGLRAFLSALEDIEVVDEAAGGEQALRAVERLQTDGEPIDVVLMDLLMAPMDGIAATTAMKARFPGVEVIAMTSFVEERKVLEALDAGASGYLLKDAEADEVAAAIRAAHRGELHLDPAMARGVMGRLRQAPSAAGPLDGLTEREREVLVLVARGQANKEIAQRLVISERTARTHVSNILGKLGLHSRTQAALLAVREGLVDSEG